MRIRYTESFPAPSGEAEESLRLIRKIVGDRLAAEALRRAERQSAQRADRSDGVQAGW